MTFPKKLNPFCELNGLSDKITQFHNYHGQFNSTNKDYVIYSSLGEAMSESQLLTVLNFYKNKKIVILSTQHYQESLTTNFNCKIFTIPSAYAYYVTEMPKLDVNFDRTFNKVFLSLNNRAQWNRLALYQFLVKFDLLKHFYFSYLHEDRVNVGRCLYNQQQNIIGNTWFNQGLDHQKLQNALPIKLDNFGGNDWGPGNIEYYEHSFCSFVNETYINENHNAFLTEKVMKPFAYGHPMLLFSSAGALQLLRQMKFETFDSIFDESYDLIESPQQRFERLLEIVQTVCSASDRELKSMYNKIRPKLEYNYNKFWNHWYAEYLDDIAFIQLQIRDFFKI